MNNEILSLSLDVILQSPSPYDSIVLNLQNALLQGHTVVFYKGSSLFNGKEVKRFTLIKQLNMRLNTVVSLYEMLEEQQELGQLSTVLRDQDSFTYIDSNHLSHTLGEVEYFLETESISRNGYRYREQGI